MACRSRLHDKPDVRVAQVAPPKSAPSHSSLPSATPSPQVIEEHPDVSKVQLAVQARVPPSNPRSRQLVPARLDVSQSSPLSTRPSPQVGVALSQASPIPSSSLSAWPLLAVPGQLSMTSWTSSLSASSQVPIWVVAPELELG